MPLREGITLADKLASRPSQRGRANIEQLNTVRKQLSASRAAVAQGVPRRTNRLADYLDVPAIR